MLQVHERLGDFEIIRLLGKGGMGEVYEAIQFNPERRVALKVLASWLARDEEALQRFWREAKVPANLDHPGIVRIISTGKTPDGVAYYAMHLVRGISLADMIRRANAAAGSDAGTRSLETANTPSAAAPLDGDNESPAFVVTTGDSIPPLMQDYRHDCFTSVARVGVQAARALAYAHEQGFLHRDIKPSNLMVDVHDHVYLVDFGLTRALQPSDDVTQPGAVIGTPWYMSPEQANGKTLDARSDIYSLGVTLFDLATFGLGPFTANRDNKNSVLAQVRAGQTLPLRLLAPGIPPALEQIIVRAMQHKPARRYESAAEMARDLEAFLGNSSKPSQRSPRKPAGAGRKRWLLVAAAVAMVLAAAAVLAFAFRERPVETAPNHPKVEPAGARAKLDGTQAFPEILRAAGKNIPVSLLDNDAKPIWSEPIMGNCRIGTPTKPQAQQLWLHSFSTLNALALADPDWPCFEFSVEICAIDEKGTAKNEVGIFFGQCRDADPPGRCFVVRLDHRPSSAPPFGQLTWGTGRLVRESKKYAEIVEWPASLPNAPSAIRLTSTGWHVLKLRVEGEAFSLHIDQAPAREFSLGEMRKADANAAMNLSTSGAVGVWSRHGMGLFRKAMLVTLPAKSAP
jgi:serine/threonine protein kinase